MRYTYVQPQEDVTILAELAALEAVTAMARRMGLDLEAVQAVYREDGERVLIAFRLEPIPAEDRVEYNVYGDN